MRVNLALQEKEDLKPSRKFVLNRKIKRHYDAARTPFNRYSITELKTGRIFVIYVSRILTTVTEEINNNNLILFSLDNKNITQSLSSQGLAFLRNTETGTLFVIDQENRGFQLEAPGIKETGLFVEEEKGEGNLKIFHLGHAAGGPIITSADGVVTYRDSLHGKLTIVKNGEKIPIGILYYMIKTDNILKIFCNEDTVTPLKTLVLRDPEPADKKVVNISKMEIPETREKESFFEAAEPAPNNNKRHRYYFKSDNGRRSVFVEFDNISGGALYGSNSHEAAWLSFKMTGIQTESQILGLELQRDGSIKTDILDTKTGKIETEILRNKNIRNSIAKKDPKENHIGYEFELNDAPADVQGTKVKMLVYEDGRRYFSFRSAMGYAKELVPVKITGSGRVAVSKKQPTTYLEAHTDGTIHVIMPSGNSLILRIYMEKNNGTHNGEK